MKLSDEFVSRYEVVKRLGEGGMGYVLLARDRQLGRHVAIKFLLDPQSDEGSLRRFREEAKVCALLAHPNIVTLFDVGDEQGHPFLVFEYVEGTTLEGELAREKQLTVARALEVTQQVLQGLEHAHQQGVVHRDLKPPNILIRGDETRRAMVMDFGVAKHERKGRTVQTQTGVILGTPYYMPPEVITGGKVTPLADFYSLGCMLYECLAGSPPFTGRTEIEVLERHVRAEPVPLPEVRPDIPLEVWVFVGQMLEKDPAARLPTATEMLDAIAKVREGKSYARLRIRTADRSLRALPGDRAGSDSSGVLRKTAADDAAPPVSAARTGPSRSLGRARQASVKTAIVSASDAGKAAGPKRLGVLTIAVPCVLAAIVAGALLIARRPSAREEWTGPPITVELAAEELIVSVKRDGPTEVKAEGWTVEPEPGAPATERVFRLRRTGAPVQSGPLRLELQVSASGRAFAPLALEVPRSARWYPHDNDISQVTISFEGPVDPAWCSFEAPLGGQISGGARSSTLTAEVAPAAMKPDDPPCRLKITKGQVRTIVPLVPDSRRRQETIGRFLEASREARGRGILDPDPKQNPVDDKLPVSCPEVPVRLGSLRLPAIDAHAFWLREWLRAGPTHVETKDRFELYREISQWLPAAIPVGQIHRPPKEQSGWRHRTTPDVLAIVAGYFVRVDVKPGTMRTFSENPDVLQGIWHWGRFSADFKSNPFARTSSTGVSIPGLPARFADRARYDAFKGARLLGSGAVRLIASGAAGNADEPSRLRLITVGLKPPTLIRLGLPTRFGTPVDVWLAQPSRPQGTPEKGSEWKSTVGHEITFPGGLLAPTASTSIDLRFGPVQEKDVGDVTFVREYAAGAATYDEGLEAIEARFFIADLAWVPVH